MRRRENAEHHLAPCRSSCRIALAPTKRKRCQTTRSNNDHPKGGSACQALQRARATEPAAPTSHAPRAVRPHRGTRWSSWWAKRLDAAGKATSSFVDRQCGANRLAVVVEAGRLPGACRHKAVTCPAPWCAVAGHCVGSATGGITHAPDRCRLALSHRRELAALSGLLSRPLR
jgi:hypothetical protein